MRVSNEHILLVVVKVQLELKSDSEVSGVCGSAIVPPAWRVVKGTNVHGIYRS
jgi:hypothetical protein